MTDDIEWGYAKHHYSIRDVDDEERWQREEQWAIEESLKQAAASARPRRASSAAYFLETGFIDRFQSHLDANLHRPLEVCTTRTTVEPTDQQDTEQLKLTALGGDPDGD